MLDTVYEMKINGSLCPFGIDSLMSSIVGIFLYPKQMHSEIRTRCSENKGRLIMVNCMPDDCKSIAEELVLEANLE